MQMVSRDRGSFETVEAVSPAPVPASQPRPAWSGDSDDWSSVLEKLGRLRQLDRGLTAFGAARHHYRLAPPATAAEVSALEKRLKVKLPPGLRAFLSHVGNGGAGPGYGLFSLADVKGFKPSKPYPGVAALRAAAPRGASLPSNPCLAPLRPSERAGMVAIADFGCGILSAVVTTGDVGRVVTLDDEGLSETDDTLVMHFGKWLDEELRRFELAAQLRAEGAPRETMIQAFRRAFPKREKLAAIDLDTALRGLEPGKE
jgi:hypothetical protein